MNSPLVSEAAQVIRQRGDLWSIHPAPGGTLFRAYISGRNVRVWLHGLRGKTPPPNAKEGTPIQVVSTLEKLAKWLDSFKEDAEDLPFGPPTRDS